MLGEATHRAVAAAPLRFIPGATQGAGLVFRGDAMSLALSEPVVD
jgi:hypothetical protein